MENTPLGRILFIASGSIFLRKIGSPSGTRINLSPIFGYISLNLRNLKVVTNYDIMSYRQFWPFQRIEL